LSSSRNTRAYLSTDDKAFINKLLQSADGWLMEDAADLTTFLLNAQVAAEIGGPCVEFGVYHGKYLLLLHHSERKRGGWVGGYDIFEECHPEYTWRKAEELFGTRDGVALWRQNTSLLGSEDVLAMLGEPSRFVSVDGDHSAEGAFHDLTLAAGVLHEKGVVALDDIYNPMAIGVSEGSFRFLIAEDCPLLPFAYCGNKLFLCRKEQYQTYFELAESIVSVCPHLLISKSFQERAANGRQNVAQRLMGHDVLIFTPWVPSKRRWSWLRWR